MQHHPENLWAGTGRTAPLAPLPAPQHARDKGPRRAIAGTARSPRRRPNLRGPQQNIKINKKLNIYTIIKNRIYIYIYRGIFKIKVMLIFRSCWVFEMFKISKTCFPLFLVQIKG